LDNYSVRPTNTLDPAVSSATGEDDISQFIGFVSEVHRLLRSASDLSPANPAVADMIARFRQRLKVSYRLEAVEAVLEDRRIRPIRRELLAMLSKVEGLEELYEAKRLIGETGNGLDLLASLPSWSVYESLAGKEMQCFESIRDSASSPSEPILFVGSGPLPLSAIVMRLNGRTNTTCLDLNPEACEVSERLVRRLGLEESIAVLPKDGAEFDYRPYRRILVASLVTDKAAVLERIRSTSPEAIVGVRTAEGMRRLMYEAVDETRLTDQGWRIAARTTPQENLVMNSTIFLTAE
jgi:hypothetical protein